MKPTLRQFQYFVAITESGNIGDAARRLGVSQPSLSAQLADMEHHLGARLFERGRHGALPTPAAERILPHARHILREAQTLKAAARESATTLSGRLRLGALPSVGPYLLPPALRELHSRYPDLRVEVREERDSELAAHLLEGRFDVVIGLHDPDGQGESYRLLTERFYICSAHDDPLAGKGPISPEALKGRTLLSLGSGHRLTAQVAALAEISGARVSIDYEGTSLDAIRAMSAMGDSIAILPSLYAVSEAKSDPGLTVRPIDSPLATREIALTWRRTSSMRGVYRELGEQLARVAETIRV